MEGGLPLIALLSQRERGRLRCGIENWHKVGWTKGCPSPCLSARDSRGDIVIESTDGTRPDGPRVPAPRTSQPERAGRHHCGIEHLTGVTGRD